MKAIVSNVSGNTRMYLFLFLLTLGSTLGLQGSSLLYTNYAVEVGGFSAAEKEWNYAAGSCTHLLRRWKGKDNRFGRSLHPGGRSWPAPRGSSPW